MFKVNRLTSEQQSVENCFNLICWLKINHDRLQATYKMTTLFYQNKTRLPFLEVYKGILSTVLFPYVTRIYSYAIRMSLVCHSYVLVCHPYVTHMYSHVIRMSLVCGFTKNHSEAYLDKFRHI